MSDFDPYPRFCVTDPDPSLKIHTVLHIADIDRAATPGSASRTRCINCPISMAASAPISKTIYLGAFAHSASLAELDVCAKGAIGVDDEGVIAFVERDIEIGEVRRRHVGWEEARVVEVKDGFFFPGFIGELLES